MCHIFVAQLATTPVLTGCLPERRNKLLSFTRRSMAQHPFSVHNEDNHDQPVAQDNLTAAAEVARSKTSDGLGEPDQESAAKLLLKAARAAPLSPANHPAEIETSRRNPVSLYVRKTESHRRRPKELTPVDGEDREDASSDALGVSLEQLIRNPLLFTNEVTLEHALYSAGNADLLREVFLELHPRSQARWDDEVLALPEAGRANGFVDLLKSVGERKGDFAQSLAERIAQGRPFTVPQYIRQAIAKVSEA